MTYRPNDMVDSLLDFFVSLAWRFNERLFETIWRIPYGTLRYHTVPYGYKSLEHLDIGLIIWCPEIPSLNIGELKPWKVDL